VYLYTTPLNFLYKEGEHIIGGEIGVQPIILYLPCSKNFACFSNYRKSP